MQNDKSLGTVFSETKDELKEFIQTRVAMLQAELKEKVQTWKYSIPIALIAAALLLAAWITLTFMLVALISAWFMPGPYAWVWGSLIVGGVYLLSGIALGWFAYSEIKNAGVTPNRTIAVLKQDQVWIQNETRAA